MLPWALPLPGRVSLVPVLGAKRSPAASSWYHQPLHRAPAPSLAGDRTAMDCSTHTSSQGVNVKSCRAVSAVGCEQGRTVAVPWSGCQFPISDTVGGRGSHRCQHPAGVLLPSWAPPLLSVSTTGPASGRGNGP